GRSGSRRSRHHGRAEEVRSWALPQAAVAGHQQDRPDPLLGAAGGDRTHRQAAALARAGFRALGLDRRRLHRARRCDRRAPRTQRKRSGRAMTTGTSDIPALLRAMSRLVVKIGSSLLTNDGRGLDESAIAGWADQIARLTLSGREVVLVSS